MEYNDNKCDEKNKGSEKNEDDVQERLQKYLARCNVASRRKCEEYIMQGRVLVNGKIVTELGNKINPEKDEVIFDGKKVRLENEKIYILLNKPIGYVTTVNDQFNRDTVLDLVKVNKRIVPVGRLDMYTSGALILTNDGDFVYKVTHPKHEITKTYTVTLIGKVTDEELDILRNGVELDDGFVTSKAHVRRIKEEVENKKENEKIKTRLEITIHEGKNRQIRRMCEAINKKVIALHRTKIGDISVKNLEIGKWRYLTEKEVAYLIK